MHHLVGVAVTPVVCFLGELGETQLNPNPSEVAEVFTVPLESFLDRDRWVHKVCDSRRLPIIEVCLFVSLTSTNIPFLIGPAYSFMSRSITLLSSQAAHIQFGV